MRSTLEAGRGYKVRSQEDSRHDGVDGGVLATVIVMAPPTATLTGMSDPASYCHQAMGFNQRDRRWRNHTLGTGPHIGTIGAYGCVLATSASIAKLAGVDTDPLDLNQQFIDNRIYFRDPTGTIDFLPDDALARLPSKRFKHEGTYPGLNVAKVDGALPTPDVYVELHIATSRVPTHRVYVWSGRHGVYRIDDPWGGLRSTSSVVHALNDYGGAAAVKKTILIRALRPALKPQFAARRQPAEPPSPETPDPPIPDEPERFYRFVIRGGVAIDEPPPADEVTQESIARTIARDWVADQPKGTVLRVEDTYGNLVFNATAIGIPVTG
jgi:hypothetical protein